MLVDVDDAAAFAEDAAIRAPLHDALVQTLVGVKSAWVVIEDLSVARQPTSTVQVKFEIMVPAGYMPPATSAVETANFAEALAHTLEVNHMRFAVQGVRVQGVAVSHPRTSYEMFV